MSGIWDFFTKIFKNAETSSPTVPAEHKLIERTEDELTTYNRWHNSEMRKRMLSWLNEQYAAFVLDSNQNDPSIDFLRTPSVQGFVIHFHQTNYSYAEAQNLLDYLKERIKLLDYRSALSDSRTYARNGQVETAQKHYLKPRTKAKDGMIDQLFGNVSIELIIRDEQPYNLKFSATHYNDALYCEPNDFQELMRTLVSAS